MGCPIYCTDYGIPIIEPPQRPMALLGRTGPRPRAVGCHLVVYKDRCTYLGMYCLGVALRRFVSFAVRSRFDGCGLKRLRIHTVGTVRMMLSQLEG